MDHAERERAGTDRTNPESNIDNPNMADAEDDFNSTPATPSAPTLIEAAGTAGIVDGADNDDGKSHFGAM